MMSWNKLSGRLYIAMKSDAQVWLLWLVWLSVVILCYVWQINKVKVQTFSSGQRANSFFGKTAYAVMAWRRHQWKLPEHRTSISWSAPNNESMDRDLKITEKNVWKKYSLP